MSNFSAWQPLSREALDAHAPRGPAAVQVRRAAGLVQYPTGKSAMVFYFYAPEDAHGALSRHFVDELDAPGARGHGPLLWRVDEDEESDLELERLFEEFIVRFGRSPALHPDESDVVGVDQDAESADDA